MSSANLFAAISILISSAALAGVGASLLLQTRQLRVSQIQASRTAQAELIRLTIDHAEIAAVALGVENREDLVARAYLNLTIKGLEMHYSIGTFNTEGLRSQASWIFRSEFARDWWPTALKTYFSETNTSRERQFYEIMDMEYQRIRQASDSADNGNSL